MSVFSAVTELRTRCNRFFRLRQDLHHRLFIECLGFRESECQLLQSSRYRLYLIFHLCLNPVY